MIVVTGATGRVGGATTRSLAAAGADVRALVRDADRADLARTGEAQVAVGDFDEPATLDAAFDGADVLVLVSPGVPEQEIAAVDAARRAGIEHVVYLTSKASADSPIARRRWHHAVEQHILGAGLAWSFLRSNAYMQNTLALAPVIRRTGGFASSAGEGRMGMVDARDVAAVAAAIARDPAQHHDATYLLTGPTAITYREVAAVLSELLGRPVDYRVSTFEDDRAAMRAAGVPDAVATMNAQAFSLNATGDADWLSQDVERITGSRPRDFHRFATDHLAAFRG